MVIRHTGVDHKAYGLTVGTLADAVSTFQLGATITQNSVDWWNGTTTDVARAITNLNASTGWKNQHLTSFGVLSPEETTGTRDWSSLDERLNLTWNNADHLNLTLAMAPTWMDPVDGDGSGVSGTTDWTHINELAPTTAHNSDFASLCAAAVSRYTGIEAVHVWNELKGYWNSSLSRADYEGYTTMYNAVYTAVKGARSTVKVGGPYCIIYVTGGSTTTELSGPWGYVSQETCDTIKYWLANKTGADYILLDGGNMTADNSGLVTPIAAAEQIVPAVVSWIRGLNNTTYPGAATLPIVFAEWYIWGAHWLSAQPSHAQTAATWTVGTLAALRAGVSRAYIWEPMGDNSGDLAPYSPLGLVTNTAVASGGQQTELYTVAKIIKDHFSAGRSLYDVNTGNSNIYGLGSNSGSGQLCLVNKTGSSQTTSGMPGTSPQTLSAWEVRSISWIPS